MRCRPLLILATVTALVTNAGSEPDPKPTLERLTPPFWQFDWTGEEGITWFVQGSDNLEDWHYYPLVDFGVEHDTVDFTSSSPRYFMRLQHTDIPPIAGNAEAMDFDGDGLPSLFEVSIFGTDPLVFDSDGDLIGDAEEFANPSALPATTLEVFTPLQ